MILDYPQTVTLPKYRYLNSNVLILRPYDIKVPGNSNCKALFESLFLAQLLFRVSILLKIIYMNNHCS